MKQGASRGHVPSFYDETIFSFRRSIVSWATVQIDGIAFGVRRQKHFSISWTSTTSAPVKMHLHLVLSIVAAGLVGQTSAVSNTSSELPLNGWHACSAYTFAGQGQEDYGAQCLTFGAPLCYPGVCEPPANVYPTINVFVKMLPATGANADHATNVWMFASGASNEGKRSFVLCSD